jgi:methionyl-tRNA formyltransferase
MSGPKVNIVYMGTPEFAVEPLKALLDDGFNIAAVITSPDKPAGRGKKIQSSAVKIFAESLGLKVLQPEKLKDPIFLDELRLLKPDLQVVVAFRMLPETVWRLPALGTFNLHASLLPQYRGAAPINHAIINGEKESGVTTFFIDDKIDTGKILFQEKVQIPRNYSAGDLHDKLMETGSSLVVKTVKAIISGDWKEVPQDSLINSGEMLHAAPKIFKEDCEIDWKMNGQKIENFIRGLSPSPSAYSWLISPGESPLQTKIFKTTFIAAQHSLSIGSILIPDRKSIYVAVTDGYISLIFLQLSGKNKLDAVSFLNGFKNILNCHFKV